MPAAAFSAPGQPNAATVQPQAVAVSADWPQFHNGPTREGYNAQEYVLTASNLGDLGVAWTGTTGNDVTSSPAVSNGVVYVGSVDGKLYAYPVGCASFGGACSPIWKGTTSSDISSSPAVSNGVVYVGSSDGKLYAYAVGCNSGGGDCYPIWTAATSSAITTAPAVADGVVYVRPVDGTLRAFDAAGGATYCTGTPGVCTPIWTGVAGAIAVGSSPAVAGGVVYVGSTDGKLYAFAVGCDSGGGTCKPIWTATTGGGILSTPAVANGVVYVGSGDTKLHAFDAAGVTGCSGIPKECAPLWTGATADRVDSSPAVANGVVYVGSVDDKLYAFDAAGGATNCTGSTPNKTCTPIWIGPTGGDVISSPAVAGGLVYVGSADGKLYLFEVGCSSGGGTCGIRGTLTTGDAVNSSPAVVDGVVYFGSNDNKLYACGLIGATYFTVPPVRVLDSRPGTGHIGAALFHSRVKQTFAVATIASGVPTGAIAVTGNVTVVSQSRAGFVTLAPSLTSGVLPSTSTINFPLADTRANGVTVSLGAGGTLDAMYWTPSSADTVHLLFDVTGYFLSDPSGATYFTVPPVRVLDSRPGTGHIGAALFHSRVKQTFAVATVASGVPTGAIAVTGNVTVVSQSRAGFVTLAPSLTSGVLPSTSTINFPLADTRANGVTVSLHSGGTLDAMYWTPSSADTVHLLFDVTGYFRV
jgi:outer membrane protein assembly factor BamB